MGIGQELGGIAMDFFNAEFMPDGFQAGQVDVAQANQFETWIFSNRLGVVRAAFSHSGYYDSIKFLSVGHSFLSIIVRASHTGPG
jgi:hypothetical protein